MGHGVSAGRRVSQRKCMPPLRYVLPPLTKNPGYVAGYNRSRFHIDMTSEYLFKCSTGWGLFPPGNLTPDSNLYLQVLEKQQRFSTIKILNFIIIKIIICKNSSWKIQTSGEGWFWKFGRTRTGGGLKIRNFGGRPLQTALCCCTIRRAAQMSQ